MEFQVIPDIGSEILETSHVDWTIDLENKSISLYLGCSQLTSTFFSIYIFQTNDGEIHGGFDFSRPEKLITIRGKRDLIGWFSSIRAFCEKHKVKKGDVATFKRTPTWEIL